jgi:hypothetical protein
MSEQPSALSELRKLGLTINIDEPTAARIWGELLIIAGRVRQGYYTDPGDHWFIQNGKNDLDAYHAIAKEIVNPQTADETIEDLIPHVVYAFHGEQEWFPSGWSIEAMKARILSGPIQEWKGKRFLLAAASPSQEKLKESEDLPTVENEVERRQQLLASYKSATGNPSNRKIYEAVNSGIHKPEFYHWQKGNLSSDSVTCINFERFLRDKKPPIPRRPRD